MNDAYFFDVLEKYVNSKRNELELKMARQKLRHVERYRERLLQHIKELEQGIKNERTRIKRNE